MTDINSVHWALVSSAEHHPIVTGDGLKGNRCVTVGQSEARDGREVTNERVLIR